jgi:hypothetical protein
LAHSVQVASKWANHRSPNIKGKLCHNICGPKSKFYFNHRNYRNERSVYICFLFVKNQRVSKFCTYFSSKDIYPILFVFHIYIRKSS